MFNWLNPVRDVLDHNEKPIPIFFRDDDAGWENGKLYVLLDEFAQAGLPVDVAVIPEVLDQALTDGLLSRWQQNRQLIGLHQHGYSHSNHEPSGRKCEFGSSRTKNQQRTDIARGQEHLQAMLGDALDPFFTPPWNRCTQTTVDCLEKLGFQLLSRDATAVNLQSSILRQVPVHIDWSLMMKALPDPLSALGQAIANALQTNTLTGIMLHHAVMDSESFKTLAELLAVLADHNNVHGLLLRKTLG